MQNKKSKNKNKKGFTWSQLGYWLLALIVLVFIVYALFLMKEKGVNLVDKIKDVLRFGR